MHTASGMLQGVTWVIGLVFHHACYENICIGCLLVRASCTARSHRRRSAPVSDLRWSSRGLEFLISTLQRRKKASPFSIKKVLPLRFLVKVPGECSHLSLSGSRAIGAVCELLRPPKSLCRPCCSYSSVCSLSRRPHTLKLDGIYHFVMITYGRSSITDNNFN